MKTYARIQNGVVAELFQTDDDITQMFHPDMVWVEAGASVREGWTYDGSDFAPPMLTTPSPAQVEAAKVAIVQAHMDEAARALRYDSIMTAITYAEESAVPKFQAEGQAFRAWRSLVWAKCYEILDEVNDGKRPIPSDEELIAELPELNL